jgi:hypothetical protein
VARVWLEFAPCILARSDLQKHGTNFEAPVFSPSKPGWSISWHSSRAFQAVLAPEDILGVGMPSPRCGRGIRPRRMLGGLLPSLRLPLRPRYKQGVLGIHCRSMSYFRATAVRPRHGVQLADEGPGSVEGRVHMWVDGTAASGLRRCLDGEAAVAKLVEWNSSLAYQMPIPSRKMSGRPLACPLSSRTSNGRPHVAGSDRVGQKIFHAQFLPSWMVEKSRLPTEGCGRCRLCPSAAALARHRWPSRHLSHVVQVGTLTGQGPEM